MIVRDFPYPCIEIACRKCERRGSYAPARFDPDLPLPDLLNQLSAGCSRTDFLDRCGAYYPQLVKTSI